jgi:hypothetical protein
VDPAHLPASLNEFVFPFNRRHSRSRGTVFYRVLELATGHEPVAITTSSPPGSHGRRRRYGEAPASRPAWNVLLRIGPGEPPRCNSGFHSA